MGLSELVEHEKVRKVLRGIFRDRQRDARRGGIEMRAVVQRVKQASVSVDNKVVGAIGPGLVVLLGIKSDDGETEAKWLAHKVANLRIFADERGKTKEVMSIR